MNPSNTDRAACSLNGNINNNYRYYVETLFALRSGNHTSLFWIGVEHGTEYGMNRLAMSLSQNGLEVKLIIDTRGAPSFYINFFRRTHFVNQYCVSGLSCSYLLNTNNERTSTSLCSDGAFIEICLSLATKKWVWIVFKEELVWKQRTSGVRMI